MSESPKPLIGLSAVKLALMAQQLRAQAQHVLRAEPIAIVGMGCRVPGGGDTPERFWELLCDGRDPVREVPADRWEAGAWYDADLSAAGKTATKHAAFLDRIDGFDADYFGILPREAQRMDPQQRLFLEVAIEALDDAGLTRAQLRGSRAGVFVASYHNDYAQLQYSDVDAIDPRTLTGTLHSVLANRLSHFLDLRGPSVSIDTACSSSLVAMHLACQSLRCGESDVALAGGVSLMVTPELLVSMSKVGFMSPDGRCKTFDERADGFGRGEGCGIVVLKRLADAISDGDRVLAVVRGSAVNQDGHSTLLAAPSGPAQQALIEEALANAQLEAGRIGLMEAHGTGTALGDPIEVEAIAATIGRAVEGAGTCLLGSVKANIGHLEAAAGVAGLIKTVLALRHEAVPAQPHFRRLNPHISLEGSRLAVPTRLLPWPKSERPRCAAVSSFGVGGTNAHVIVEEAPELAGARTCDRPDDAWRVLPLSAHSEPALCELAETWQRFLTMSPEKPGDLCYTAAQRRQHHDHRLAVVGRTAQEFADRLADLLAEQRCTESAPAHAARRPAKVAAARVVFVFSGQGPQWHAMGRELLAGEPVFRAALEDCDRLLRPLAGWSLLDELAAPQERSRLDETVVAQPALFALQVGVAALLKSWGVEPAAVLGHSVGEIAALHVAGVLTLEQAVHVVWHRGRIMQAATGQGAMAAVGIDAGQAADLLRPYGERLSLAAVNAPQSVVLSGDADALAQAMAELAARGISHQRLPVRYAFHSAQMAPLRQRLAEALTGLHTSSPRLSVYSTVTGGAAADMAFDAAYFGRNLRDPVRFADAMAAAAEDGHELFVEIGPHPVLAGAMGDCLAARQHGGHVLASLRRGRPERESLLLTCAGFYAAGGMPAWSALQDGGAVVTLPGTPWQRTRHWLRARPAPISAREAHAMATAHPLLGRSVAIAGQAVHVFEGSSSAAQAWLADHRIFDTPVLPAAGVIEAFTAAARAVAPHTPMSLTGFTMERPVLLADEGPTRWQTVVSGADAGALRIELFEAVESLQTNPEAAHREALRWHRVASATAAPVAGASARAAIDDRALVAVAPDDIYARFAELGVAFGPSFRCLREVFRGEKAARAWVELPESTEVHAGVFGLHPVLLDAALQLCSIAAVSLDAAQAPERVLLPLGAERIELNPTTAVRLLARAAVRQLTERSLVADLSLEAPEGERVLAIEGLCFSAAEPGAFAKADGADPWLYELRWHRAPGPESRPGSRLDGAWLLLADRAGVADALAEAIVAQGGHCLRVVAGTEFAQTAHDVWTLDPLQPQHFGRLFGEVLGSEPSALRGVVHLWSLDLAPCDLVDDTALQTGDRLGTASVLHLTQVMAAADPAAGLWLVTRGAQAVTGGEPAVPAQARAAGLWGLGSVIASEHPELHLRRLDLDPEEDVAGGATRLAQALVPGAAGRDIAWRDGQAWTPRLERYAAPSPAARQRLEVRRPGTIDGIGLRPMQRPPLNADEVRLRVHASGLNFRDVLLALGMHPDGGIALGAEAAGTVLEIGAAVSDFVVGDVVFGHVPASLASEAVAPAAFLAKLPAELGFAEAAALPVAFLSAHHGLHGLARLKRGERVLIHAAAGGVGMAAVQLAQRCGAVVFATAGSEEKRQRLRELGVEHVMDSRSLDFADCIAELTAGRGVHVVLNSLAGDFIAAGLRTLGPNGRFIELGKRDILTPGALAALRPDVAYHVFDLGAEAQADRGLLRPMFADLLAGLNDGSLRPLPLKRFALDDAESAFRFMSQARHIGKIVLEMPAPPSANERLVVPGATYWITGGLGALGLATARWLIRRGATHLLLSGRRPPGDSAAEALASLRAGGAEVRVVMADAGDRERMQEVLDDAVSTLPPLRGIVHAAGALHDGVLMNQRWDGAQAVLRGKAHGAWVLHELTRAMPLDFFILYSAAGLLLGPHGQGLYPAANAELDALAQMRRRAGLPALSVAWGAWGGAGMAAAAAASGHDGWSQRGLRKIEPEEAFARLESLLRLRATCAAVLPIDWSRFLARLPEGLDPAFFATVAPRGPRPGPAPASEAATFGARLRLLPAGQRRDALARHLTERALHVLGLAPSTVVDPRAPLKDIGLDSLMAVELRNALTRSIGQPLPATLLFDYPTVDALAGHLAGRLGLADDVAPPAMPASAMAARPHSELAVLSDAEAEALLLAELDEPAGNMP